MKSTEFCYWLQGLFELATPTQLNADQTAAIRAHLNMVFIHEIDPSYPEGQQSALDAAHSGGGNVFGTGSSAADLIKRPPGMRC